MVQKVIHYMRNKKRREGYMAIKLGLEKAYDRIDWSFIIDTTKDASTPSHLVELIEECLSSSMMQVLWNG